MDIFQKEKEVPGFQPNDFWVIVALDYDKENAYVMAMSEDLIYCDGQVNDNNLLDDRSYGGTDEWVKKAVPGLWKIQVRGWSHQDWQGEWDSGWDIIDVPDLKPILLVPFNEDLSFFATHTHKKRGTSYKHIATAILQTEKPVVDNEPLELYIGEDGKYWARPTEEFNDGRFEEIKYDQD